MIMTGLKAFDKLSAFTLCISAYVGVRQEQAGLFFSYSCLHLFR